MTRTVNVAEVTAPDWRHRIRFCEDCYADKAQGPLKGLIGWSLGSIKDLCQDRGWKINVKLIEIDEA